MRMPILALTAIVEPFFSNPTRFKDFTELKEDMNVACIKDHCYVVTVCAYTEHRDLNKATRSSFMMRIICCIILLCSVFLSILIHKFFYSYISRHYCRYNIASDGLSSTCGCIYISMEIKTQVMKHEEAAN